MKRALAVIALVGAAGFAHAHVQHATVPDITPGDLETRLRAFAHDSMEGRRTGTAGHARAAAYITRELTRLRVTPAGGRNSYAQPVPLVLSTIDSANASLGIFNGTLMFGVDFLPIPGSVRAPYPRDTRIRTPSLIYGGRLGDSGGPDSTAVRNAFVLLAPPSRADGQPDYQVWDWTPMLSKYREAAGVGIIALEVLPLTVRNRLTSGEFDVEPIPKARAAPPVVLLSRGGAASLMRGDPERMKIGPPRRTLALQFAARRSRLDAPAANVIAVIEGSDPRLRSEYVVLTAHMDHLGIAAAINAEGGDSVYNGADDGGTGATALLEIAEHLKSLAVRPRRSVLLLWTTGEEQGGIGAQWFLENSTVPVEQIVANINLDMIGRGTARDIPGGGPAYVRIVGSRQLSAEFGSWVQDVNARSDQPLQLDYRFDENDQRMAYLCVGDHAAFHRAGVPSVFVTTGTHADHHRVSDEADRIDYEKFARVTRFAAELTVDVANRPARPQIDARRPQAGMGCPPPGVSLR